MTELLASNLRQKPIQEAPPKDSSNPFLALKPDDTSLLHSAQNAFIRSKLNEAIGTQFREDLRIEVQEVSFKVFVNAIDTKSISKALAEVWSFDVRKFAAPTQEPKPYEEAKVAKIGCGMQVDEDYFKADPEKVREG